MIGLEPAHLVGIGGAVGAVARHAVYLRLASDPDDGLPLSTLAVNVAGSFVLGLVAFAGAGESAMQFLGIGVCGSFTTFSSFSVETVRLWEASERRLALVSAAGNLVCALSAIGLARLVATALF